MTLITTTTKQAFDDAVLKSDKVVLVDFWAEWCPPCRAMSPILHAVADKLDKDVDIVKVNIEDSADNAKLASEYGVQSIPNMNIFKGGKVVDTVIGMVPQAVLEDTLKSHVA